MRIPHWLMLALVAVVALVVTVYVIHRLLLWMDRRQWIFYGHRSKVRFRGPPGSRGGGGMAGVLSSFQQFVEPEVRYVQEAKDQREAASADEATPADR